MPGLILIGSAFMFFQMLGFISEYAELARRREMKVSELIMADVGQGDGFMIKIWNGNVIFVDVGEFAEKFKTAIRKPSIQNFGKRESIHSDLIFLSHDDADHAEALDGVWKDIGGHVGAIALSGYRYTYVDKLKEKNPKARTVNVAAGDLLTFSTGDSIKIIFPRNNANDTNETSKELERSANDDSLVMKTTVGSTSILFTGDASEVVERELIKSSDSIQHAGKLKELKTDILKVGHHGSKTSSSEDFIKMTNPKIALISVGKNNRYKHPTVEALQRLAQNGRDIIRTDQCGTYRIVLFENGAIGRRHCAASDAVIQVKSAKATSTKKTSTKKATTTKKIKKPATPKKSESEPKPRSKPKKKKPTPSKESASSSSSG